MFEKLKSVACSECGETSHPIYHFYYGRATLICANVSCNNHVMVKNTIEEAYEDWNNHNLQGEVNL